MGTFRIRPGLRRTPSVECRTKVWCKARVQAAAGLAIRFYLDRERRLRDRALFDLAIDSKLRGCDVVKVRIGDLVSGPRCGSGWDGGSLRRRYLVHSASRQR